MKRLFFLLACLMALYTPTMAQNNRNSKKVESKGNESSLSKSLSESQKSLSSDYSPLRIEIEVAEDDIPYAILPVDKLGVVVVMSLNELGSRNPRRRISFYDQNLDRRWTSTLSIEPEYQFISYRMDEDSIYFALTCLPNFKSASPLLKVSLCIADGTWQKTYFKVDIPAKTEILSLQMLKDRWGFLAMNKNDYSWYDLPLDFASLPSLKITPLDLEKSMDWCHLAIDTLSGTVYTLFRDSKLRQSELILCSHTVSGNFLTKKAISISDNQYRIVDAKIQILSPQVLCIAGTLNLSREKQDVSAYDRGSQTMGMFASLYKDGVLTSFWTRPYYEFSKLDTLLSKDAFLNFQQSKEKAKNRTLIPAFTAQVRIGKTENGFYLLGEVYDRVETTTTEMYYDYYGRMVPYTRTFFEGFRYKDAFWASFDSNGNFRKDLVFDIDRAKLFPTLSDYSQWFSDASTKEILYCYPLDAGISFRLIDSCGNPSALSTCKLQPLFEQDKVQKTWGIGLVPWYEDYFLTYGQQQIWNNRYSGKSRRNVFYLQKIKVEK